MTSRRGLAALLLIAIAVWSSCSNPRSPQSPDAVPLTLSSSGSNSLPVISALTVSATRAEVDQNVDVNATVTDTETPVGNLVFNWSANAGVVTGSGQHVTWRLPKNSTPTPVDVVITLTVVETIKTDGANGTVLVQQSTSKSSPVVRTHDSVAEISKISLHFLVDLFGNSTVSPDACLVDFSDSCFGKTLELGDVIHNRATFVLISATAAVSSITFNASKTFADIIAPCSFHDREIATGHEGTSPAGSLCVLTATYEQQRWWLCTSMFSVPDSGLMSMTEFFKRRGKATLKRE